MDADGYVTLVDRIKDLILVSGFNVYPRAVEEALYRHPDVAAATVVGMPDEYRGEAPAAFVEPRPGAAGQRALDVFRRCFDDGVLVRVTGDIVALSPPLIVERPHMDRIFGTLSDAIRAAA